jgi:hypothetical protein
MRTFRKEALSIKERKPHPNFFVFLWTKISKTHLIWIKGLNSWLDFRNKTTRLVKSLDFTLAVSNQVFSVVLLDCIYTVACVLYLYPCIVVPL